MPLTDLQIKNLKAGEKRQKKSVGNSLFVLVEPKHKAKNTKSFVGQMRWKNKQIEVRIGVYGKGHNQWSLSDARDEWNRLRKWSKEEGRDPRDLIKEEKRIFVDKTNNPTLLDVVEGWLKNISIAPSTKRDYENKLFNQVIPHFGGNTPIAQFAWSKGGREKVLKLKEQIEIRGSGSQANRVFMVMRQVFEYAIDRSWLEHPNPAMSSRFTKSKHIPQNNPCLSWEELPKLLNDLNTNRGNGSPIVIAAIKFDILTFVRVGSLVPMRWDELDYKNDLWTIPAIRMKGKKEHLVPLTSQIKRLLDYIRQFNGEEDYVFWSPRNKARPHINESSLNNHLKVRLGYGGKQTAHGLRQLPLTAGQDVLDFPPDIIQRQMAHAIGDKIRMAYDKSQQLEERRMFMDAWSDALITHGLKV